jgi:hypothetical protein
MNSLLCMKQTLLPFFLVLVAYPALGQSLSPLGRAPTYTTRTITDFLNSQAVSRRIWVPGLDEGYVPQGLTIAGGQLYVSAYQSDNTEQSRGACRLYRVSMSTGAVTGMLDLPSTCGHAGGLAKGPSGRLYVADTRIVFEVALNSGPNIGRVLRSIRLSGGVKGSFAAASKGALWLGSYERGSPGQLLAFPFEKIKDMLSDEDATARLTLPSEAQGAGFDGNGRLWISRSGSRFGELLRLNGSNGSVESRYEMPSGIEDLSFSGGALWTLSEAGSKRWIGWSGYHPIIMKIDTGKLR